jgi:hypothetical protein
MEDLVTQTWHGVRVFLTGHTGFKGGWLALWLASKGAVVRGYSLDPTEAKTTPAIFHAARVFESVDDLRSDILDRDALLKAIGVSSRRGVSSGSTSAGAPLVCRSTGNLCDQCDWHGKCA